MRRRSVLSVVLAVAGIATASLAVSACKQGRDERCQVQSDCDNGLICSLATQECSDQTNSGIDASLPQDAAPDAPPDAP